MTASLETAITFCCADDDLVGILHRPDSTLTRPLGVLIIVGGPQYRVGSHRQFVLMARKLAAAGYPVFRFDYRGMGDSTGGQRTFESIDDDIRAAAGALKQALPSISGIVLLGLCDAASAALIYCANYSDVQGLVLINPWARTEEGAARVVVRHYYLRRLFQRSLWHKIIARQVKPATSLKDVVSHARRALALRGRNTGSRSSTFLDRMEKGIGNFEGPILLLLSWRDLTAREFEDFCRRSTTWAHWLTSPLLSRSTFADADHTFSGAASLRSACDTIRRWLETKEGEHF